MPLSPSVAKRFADTKRVLLDEAAAVQRDIESMKRLEERYGPITVVRVPPVTKPKRDKTAKIVDVAENIVRVMGRPVTTLDLIGALTKRGIYLADLRAPENQFGVMLLHYSRLRSLGRGPKNLGWWWKGLSWPPSEVEIAGQR